MTFLLRCVGFYYVFKSFTSIGLAAKGLSNELDIISGNPHNSSLVDAFNDFMNECDLCDVWRLFNPDKKDYTWSRKTDNSVTARRLDYFLLNKSALNQTLDTYLFSIPTTDHRGVTLTLKVSNTVEDRGIISLITHS